MMASTVIAYAVDSTGANVRVLGRTKTATNGNFILHIHRHRRPVRLVAKGGSFVSEADGSTISFRRRRLVALLPTARADLSGISINPLTKFINALTMRQRGRYPSLRASLTAATATIKSYYGLSTDPATLLPDYTASGVGTDAGNLGLILGAFINEDQHLCPDAPGGLVKALARDISNGTFNGRLGGHAVRYCGGHLPAIAGTIDFQDALSGVTQLQNVSEAFAFGGSNNVLTANGLADGAIGGSEIYPLGPLAEITSAVTQTVPPPPSTPSPSMATARGAATATLLSNGKVLIAGGFATGSNDSAVNTTELYDPISNSFQAGPSMSDARGGAAATLLPNGKVLIAGGADGSGALASTELYDVGTNTIVPGPSMTVARQSAGATLLPSGKVLIAGGGSPDALSSTEIYDPAANTFAPGQSMDVAENLAQATLLPNGKVLITGDAVSDPQTGVSVAELYDPASNTMSERLLNTFRRSATAALLPNGKVLIAGGVGAPIPGQLPLLSSSEIYDPSKDTFVDGPSMITGHAGATAAPLANGDILIFGGYGGSTSIVILDDVEIYDPSTNSFSQGAPMRDPRLAPTATLLPNGSVLIAGGFDGTNSLSSTEIYNP
jgi:Kelch motif/Galactose oxidase, central domain